VKILLLPHCFDPAKDGGSILFSQLAYGAAKGGAEIRVLTSNCYSSDDFILPQAKIISPPYQEKNGVVINRLNVFAKGRRMFRFLELIIGKGFFTTLKQGPVFINLKEIFRRRKIDWVVGGPFPTAAVFWSWLVVRRNRAKLALIPCCHPNDKAHENKYLFEILKKANLVFCLSNYEKRFYRKLGVEEKNLAVVSGIANDFVFNYRSFKSGKFPKIPKILFLGVKAAHKKVEILIDALEILWEKEKQIRLVIAGPETLYSPRIKERINQLPLAFRKKISYLGKVSEKKKIKLIDEATILVNPSEHESFGIIFIEAWARKKPVIGADIAVLKEVINDGENGFLFKKGSASNLAKKILFLARNSNLAKKMGQNGYNKAIKNYRCKMVVEKFLEALGQK